MPTTSRQHVRAADDTANVENGWAAVCFHQGDIQRAAYFQGRLPTVLLRQLSSDQAFIYLLEAWAAILAPLILARLLLHPVLRQRNLTACFDQGCGKTSAIALSRGRTLYLA